MAGDLFAAAILALTTTKCWEGVIQRDSTKRLRPSLWRVDRLLLQPPWNIAIFFALYAACFMLLVQDTFGVSVVGQVCMGTLFVSRTFKFNTRSRFLSMNASSFQAY